MLEVGFDAKALGERYGRGERGSDGERSQLQKALSLRRPDHERLALKKLPDGSGIHGGARWK
jgi:hypothetical protein